MEGTYEDYLSFCKQNGYKPYSKADPFWRSNWAIRSDPGDYDDETA